MHRFTPADLDFDTLMKRVSHSKECYHDPAIDRMVLIVRQGFHLTTRELPPDFVSARGRPAGSCRGPAPCWRACRSLTISLVSAPPVCATRHRPGQELLGGMGVALFDSGQDAGDVAHG